MPEIKFVKLISNKKIVSCEKKQIHPTMNFLAHLYLSGKDENIQFGNFIADWVKGNKLLQYPPEIQKGISMHRKIDSFTDNHSIVMESKSKFREIYGKYAGIFVDVLYDHFLAKNWHLYSEEKLQTIANAFYIVLTKKYYFLPESIKFFLPHLIFSNRLVIYETLDGLQNSIQIMEKRTSLPTKSIEAMKVVEQNYEKLHLEFNLFFNDLRNEISYG